MEPEGGFIRRDGEIPSITSLCEACDSLDLVPVLLKEGKYATELEDDIYHQMTVMDILDRPECDFCQYILRILTSMTATVKSSTTPPPLVAVGNALIILHVRCDLRNEVLPCRALELRLARIPELFEEPVQRLRGFPPMSLIRKSCVNGSEDAKNITARHATFVRRRVSTSTYGPLTLYI